MKKLSLVSLFLFIFIIFGFIFFIDEIQAQELSDYNIKFKDGNIINVEMNELGNFTGDESVEMIEPNFRRIALANHPNDTYYGYQWHLHNTSDMDIDAPGAWEEETGSNNIVVAVIDSGVDLDHPDLIDNIWVNNDEVAGNFIDDDGNGYVDDVNGWDFITGNNNPNPSPDGVGDDWGVAHGTHVAGIIGAKGNNGKGVAGVAWKVKIMPVQVLDDEGLGDTYSIIQGINYAIDNGADIINMSFGAYGYSALEAAAVEDALDKGGILIAALGNDSLNVNSWAMYPACYPKVLGVTATNASDRASYFTNYGTDCADVAAPGSNIYSTYYTDDPAYGFNTDYGYMSGTSMATPVVSGMAAILKANMSGETRSSINDAIIGSAEDIGLENNMGSGRVNLKKALNALQSSRKPTKPKKIHAYKNKKKKKEIKRSIRTNDQDPYFYWKKGKKSDDIAGYYVYFGTKKNGKPKKQGVFQTSRSFVPSRTLKGDEKSYYIKVKSLNTDGNLSSGLRKFKYIIDTKVDRPVQMDLVKNQYGILIRWYKVQNQHIDGYHVYKYKKKQKKYVKITSKKVGYTSYFDINVEKGNTYKYKIKAFDDLGNKSSLSKRSTVYYD
ncbi:MAG: S8 family peptidase [Patescibacteria group bacterium]